MLMKKFNADLRGKPKWLLRIVVTFAVMLLAASGSMAQGSARVNLEQKNATLPEVFEQVRRQTSLSVIYSNDDVGSIGKKDYVVRNATVDQAMSQILRGTGLEYELSNNVIVIRQAPARTVQTPATVIRGRVRVADTGAPLAGATVMIVGTTTGTLTDANGRFELRAATANPVIRVSYVGYEPHDATYTGTELNIVLATSSTEMETVVVTGIFDRVADSYTASVTTFKKQDLERVSNQNLITALGNLDASFQIIESLEYGSDPNRLPDIQMRGSSNFTDMRDKYQNNPNQPLFVVDGFQTTLQKVLDMDMNRIASVTLLKDASAKALYGSRGANGVVVIETVVPGEGRLKVTYTGDMTVNVPDLTSYDLTNAAEKLELEKRAGVYSSGNAVTQQILTENYNILWNEVLRGVDTYWLSKPLRTGLDHKHSLYLEGGDDAFRYGIDISYNKVEGVMKGSDREVIAGGMNLQYRYGNFIFRDQLSVSFTKANNSPYGAYSEYSKLNQYWRAYDEDGTVREVLGSYNLANSQGSTPIYNPLINAGLNTIDRNSSMDVTNNFYAEWMAFEGMRFIGRFGLLAGRRDTEVFLPRDHTVFRQITIDSEEYFNRGRYTMSNGKSFDYTADISANYSRQWDKHLLFANAMYSTGEKNSDIVTFQAVGFANNKMDYIGQAKQYPATGSPVGSESVSREMSFVASLNYSFDERFLADATLRSNGSSLFGTKNRWNTFWSAGLGWNIHKEKFLAGVDAIERLRLRLTTGYTGSQDFNTYQAYATYKYYNESYDNIIGAYQIALANPNLKPQRTQDNNIGIDVSLLRRLDFSIDFYVKNTDDMLTPVTMPPSTGFNEYTENLGKVRNTGFEAKLNYRIISNAERQTHLSVNATVMHNRNKLIELSESLQTLNQEKDDSKGTKVPNQETNHLTNKYVTKPSVRYVEGQSMNAIWAVKSYGIDPATGREVFIRPDGTLTYTWDPRDQVVCGDDLAKVSGTLGLNFEYMGFMVSANFYYRLGGQYYNQTLVNKVENADIQYNVDRRMYTDRWHTAGEPARYKSISDRNSFTRPTSRFVQDFNELRMTTLNLTYDFRNLGFIKNNNVIERMKLSFYCNDLFRLSTVKTERGTEYPFARAYSFKLQITF